MRFGSHVDDPFVFKKADVLAAVSRAALKPMSSLTDSQPSRTWTFL
jgi:hypothetical protein